MEKLFQRKASQILFTVKILKIHWLVACDEIFLPMSKHFLKLRVPSTPESNKFRKHFLPLS